MEIELHYFEDCPNWETADRHLRALAPKTGASERHRLVRTPQEATDIGFRGSPSVLVDGRDPFARGDEQVGLSCRIYQAPKVRPAHRRLPSSPPHSVSAPRWPTPTAAERLTVVS